MSYRIVILLLIGLLYWEKQDFGLEESMLNTLEQELYELEIYNSSKNTYDFVHINKIFQNDLYNETSLDQTLFELNNTYNHYKKNNHFKYHEEMKFLDSLNHSMNNPLQNWNSRLMNTMKFYNTLSHYLKNHYFYCSQQEINILVSDTLYLPVNRSFDFHIGLNGKMDTLCSDNMFHFENQQENNLLSIETTEFPQVFNKTVLFRVKNPVTKKIETYKKEQVIKTFL